jgi:hypothetical protein
MGPWGPDTIRVRMNEQATSVTVPPESPRADGDAQLPWYVYDRYANLLHIAQTLPEAESWAVAHWGVVEIREREEVADNDYWYLLLTPKPDQSFQFESRDRQARIVRRDRVVELGRDPQAEPLHRE